MSSCHVGRNFELESINEVIDRLQIFEVGRLFVLEAVGQDLVPGNEQVGMIFDDFDSWKAAIQTIKDKYEI